MAQDVTTVVNDFLRDAQYRVAELSVEIDDLNDEGNSEYYELIDLRRQLLVFMDIVYWGRHPIIDGYNFLAGGNAWTDAEIIKECHYLRSKANLNPVPYINWNNYNPEIVSFGDSGTTGNTVNGAVFPTGTLGQYLTYNASGNVVASAFPIYGGALSSEDIFDYFGDRA